MQTNNFYKIFFILPLAFAGLGNSTCQPFQKRTAAPTPPTPHEACFDCLVKVTNKCAYPIYLFEVGGEFALLSSTPLQPEETRGFYEVKNNPILPQKAIQAGAGIGLGANGLPDTSVACNQSSTLGACSLGWGNQGTLFEFTFNPTNSAGNIFYDISAVNGFDFPMSVFVTNPVGGTGPGQCSTIDTANLDVSGCAQNTTLAQNGFPNVRQAIYASDFNNIFTGGTDCHPVNLSSPITACRSPRTFGVNYNFLYSNPNPPSCPFTTINYTITPQSVLKNWTCDDQPNTPSSVCWTYAPQTSYYSYIKAAVGNGTTKTSIYAFPQDDGYSTNLNNGKIVNECTALTPRFTLIIGNAGTEGATGDCPPQVW